MGPIFTPPVVSSLDGPLATLQVPSEVGGANWPGGSLDPENNHLYVHSHRAVYTNSLVPANPAQSDMGYVAGQARAGGAGARAGGPGAGRGATVQGLPLLRPPYDQITAHNMNTGEIVWQKTHGSTPDVIRNHPALKGLSLPRLGQPGRTFIGVLTTKHLLIAGEGGVHTHAAGRRVALLRAYDKLTGEDAGAVEMPNRQTGSPMTYQIDGRQFIVLAVSGNDGAELLAYALP
jgi:quinoprotein glucose dehydrogenase